MLSIWNPDITSEIPSGSFSASEQNNFLKEVISEFKKNNIRTSIFVNPDGQMVEGAKACGSDRIELYTESYANMFEKNKDQAIKSYIDAAEIASNCSLGINAGHDLNLLNLSFFVKTISNVAEVSIGHALISDAIYLGLENTIQMYKRQLWFFQEYMGREGH